MRQLRVLCEKLCCESIFSSLAGDEAAVAALIRTAQHEHATPILVLETMSCLWAIMFVNKVLDARCSRLPAQNSSIPIPSLLSSTFGMVLWP
jgi:hypothetical protein